MKDIDLLDSLTNMNEQRTLIDFYFDTFLELTKDIRHETQLKSNVLLNKILPLSARYTNDLDMGVYNSEIYYNIITSHLGKLADLFDDCMYEIKQLDSNRSGGIIINELTKAWDKLEIEVYKEGISTKIEKPDMLIILNEVYNITFTHGDYSKLYEVADFYNVPRNQVDYWITESEDFL